MVIAMMCAVSASRGAVSQPCRKRYERPPKLLICPPTLPYLRRDRKDIYQHQNTQWHRNNDKCQHQTGQSSDIKVSALCKFERFKLVRHRVTAIVPIEPEK